MMANKAIPMVITNSASRHGTEAVPKIGCSTGR
jgi:hypothetical protein